MYIYLVAAFIFAVTASLIAYEKGRNSLGWFLAGLFIGPFALIVALLPRTVREGRFARCPVCTEVIPADANTCRFCGKEIEQTLEPAT